MSLRALGVVLAWSVVFGAGCGDDPAGSGGAGDGSGGGDDASGCGDAGSAEVPQTASALFGWLQSGAYTAFPAEPAPHASSGPHGTVRTYLSPSLAASLAEDGATHPQGAAAIKELYTGTSLRGWAVMVKVDPCSDGGEGWYWYEVFSTTDGSSPVVDARGAGTCTGCHGTGTDFVLTPAL